MFWSAVHYWPHANHQHTDFFTGSTDMFDISEHLLELFNDAVDMYCALGGDDDDDEESDGDLNAEIDIEESEDDKPKKKRARKQ